MPKPDAEAQKSAVVIQAEIDDKVSAGYVSQAIDIHAYKLLEIPGSVWAVRALRRLLLQNNLLEVCPCTLPHACRHAPALQLSVRMTPVRGIGSSLQPLAHLSRCYHRDAVIRDRWCRSKSGCLPTSRFSTFKTISCQTCRQKSGF